jgi:hypothetical protein
MEITNALPNLTPQLRNLALMLPLGHAELEKNTLLKSFDPELRAGLNMSYLLVATMDFILDRMGLDEGATFPELIAFLSACMRAQVPALTDAEREAIAEIILGQLMNEKDQYRRFSIPYFDAAAGEERYFDYALLRQETDEQGAIRLKLTEEGIVLHLGMLDTDPVSAQEGQELVLERLIEKGRLADALTAAGAARANSIRYKERIERVLREARRRLESVDWARDVEPVLSEARAHLSAAMTRESHMQAKVEERLDATQAEETVAQLNRLKMAIQNCYDRHQRLLATVIRTAADFRDIQSNAFRIRRQGRLPSLEDQILVPLLQARGPVIHPHAGSIIGLVLPPKPQPLFDLGQVLVVLAHERPHQTSAPELQEEETPAPSPAERALPYQPELVAEVSAFVQGELAKGAPCRLSELLDIAEERSFSAKYRRCLFLMLEQNVEASAGQAGWEPSLEPEYFARDFVAGREVVFTAGSPLNAVLETTS